MNIPRIYLDTSAIGGYFDPEFELWSKRLIHEIQEGKKIGIISNIVIKELRQAPEDVKNLLESIPKELVSTTEETEMLAQKYIEAGALTETYSTDAEHIAIASVNAVDVLASWNFKHMVNLWRIRIFNGVNLIYGYKAIEIRTPREIINE